MRTIRSMDGKDVEWFWPTEAKHISLTARRLDELKSPSAIVRILAHGDLQDFQLNRLYAVPCQRKRAVKMRRVARTILKYDLASLCLGLGEARICNLLHAVQDEKMAKQALMDCTYLERRHEEDSKALREFLKKETTK